MTYGHILKVLEAVAPYVTVDAGKVLEAFVQGDIGRLEAVRDSALSAEMKVLAVLVADAMAQKPPSLALPPQAEEGDTPAETRQSEGTLDDIVSIQQTVTKGLNPMWRCWTAGGRVVNVVSHKNESIDTFGKFKAASLLYESFFATLPVEKRVNVTPITVDISKDGQFWRVDWVKPLQFGDLPRVLEDDKPADKVHLGALAKALGGHDWVVFDLETTGFDSVDDVVQIAIIDSKGKELVNTLVRPRDADRLTIKGKGGKSAADVHGITPDKVRYAPEWKAIYEQVASALAGKVWLAYNADFDVRMLGQSLKAQSLAMPEACEVVCVMKAYAEHVGDWDEQKRDYRWHKLEDAAKACGGLSPYAHTALGDAKMTRVVAEQIGGDIAF